MGPATSWLLVGVANHCATTGTPFRIPDQVLHLLPILDPPPFLRLLRRLRPGIFSPGRTEERRPRAWRSRAGAERSRRRGARGSGAESQARGARAARGVWVRAGVEKAGRRAPRPAPAASCQGVGAQGPRRRLRAAGGKGPGALEAAGTESLQGAPRLGSQRGREVASRVRAPSAQDRAPPAPDRSRPVPTQHGGSHTRGHKLTLMCTHRDTHARTRGHSQPQLIYSQTLIKQ